MQIAFAIIAALTLVSAIGAVAFRNLVHCALSLAVAFAGLAAFYLQLGAAFVGWAQILVYIGAVAILIVFAILLTRGSELPKGGVFSRSWFMGLVIAAGVFANGKLLHGSNWTAGEVGYMHVPHATQEPAGPGEPGALESIIGGDGIRRQWSSVSVDNSKAESLTATEIFSRASKAARIPSAE